MEPACQRAKNVPKNTEIKRSRQYYEAVLKPSLSTSKWQNSKNDFLLFRSFSLVGNSETDETWQRHGGAANVALKDKPVIFMDIPQ